MAITYSEPDIVAFVQEPKPLSADWENRIKLRPKLGHNERHLDLTGDDGNQFRLILRQNMINKLDFSVILAVRVPQSNQFFRLRRYNGKSHEHTNHIEEVTFYDFHIHFATTRYQELGTREDAFAQPTERYVDFRGAFNCLIDDANFVMPTKLQAELSLGD